MPDVDGLKHLNIVVLGGSGAGKSTLLAHLLLKLGAIDSHLLARAEREAAEAGRVKGAYAWLLYRGKAERAKGHTLDLSTHAVTLASHKALLTLTDTPGSRDRTALMSRGIAGQDAALLVVDGSAGPDALREGHAETHEGLVHEQMMIANPLQVRQLVVAVSHMDAVDFEEASFVAMRDEVMKLLKKWGYSDAQREAVAIIPVAGYPGDNLVELSARTVWYERARGVTLLEALASLHPHPRPAPSPEHPLSLSALRMPVQAVMRVSGIGTVCLGRVEAGCVAPGMTVVFAPGGVTGSVKSVEVAGQPVHSPVGPGTCVGVAIKNVTKQQLRAGWVMCGAPAPGSAGLPLVTRFTAKLHIQRDDLFQRRRPPATAAEDGGQEPAGAGQRSKKGRTYGKGRGIRVGCYCPVLEVGAGHVQARLVGIEALLDPRTGQPLPGPPPASLRRGERAVVTFAPLKPALVTARDECRALGAFVLREKRYAVGLGIITETFTDRQEMGVRNVDHPCDGLEQTKLDTTSADGNGTSLSLAQQDNGGGPGAGANSMHA